MRRREFSCSLGAMVATTVFRTTDGPENRLTTISLPPRSVPTSTTSFWPRELAGIKLTQTRYTSLVVRTLSASSPAFLVNHAARTFYFGALIGEARALAFDHELLFPRLDFKHQFIRTCAKVVERFPDAASRSFMRDIGERHVASFRPHNICDGIEDSQFSD